MYEGTGRANSRRFGRRELFEVAAGAAAAAGLAYVGYRELRPNRLSVQMGISPGSQTLWRYVAQRKADLLGSLGYDVTFATYPDETTLRSDFVSNKIQVMASLTPTVASLGDAGVASQLFLPIAWLHEGYPFIVPTGSSIHTLDDLPGQRVATYPLNHPGMAYWFALGLATAHLRLPSLNPVQTLAPDSLLQKKTVDAACMGGSQWANLQTSHNFRKLVDIESAWSQLTGSSRLLIFGGYIARQDFIQQQPNFIRDLIKVHVQAFQSYTQDRANFLKVTTAYPDGPRMTDADNQAQASYLGYDNVGVDRLSVSKPDVQDYTTLFGLMAQAGYLHAPPKDPTALFYPPT